MMSRKWIGLLATLLAFGACEKAYEASSVPETKPEENDPWLFERVSAQEMMAPGQGATLLAGFGEETRTHIEMNPEGTFAATAWTAGDEFKIMGYGGGYGWYGATFATQESGTKVTFRTGQYLPNPAPYFAVYPSPSNFGSSSDGKLLISVNLPPEQTAIESGFAEGLAIAYTGTPSLTADLHFQSQVSLVRFRLSGNVVSRVEEVRLEGTSSLAGNAIIAVDPASGAGVLTQDRSFTGDVQSSVVTLSGNFEAGKDYYIVLYPGTRDFMMVFADGEGHSTTKYATGFTFPRSRISDFGTIDLGDDFTDGAFDPDPIPYMVATAGAAKPVTIAVIPEGFTAMEMPRYEMLAKSGIDALMNTEPYKSYKNYFNVWILKVASNDSGASITDGNGNIRTFRDCYFESKWGEKYRDMTANGDKVFQFVTENCPDIVNGIHPVNEVPVLMIINDARYGGICHSYSDGSGYGMAPYTYSGGAITWDFPAIVPTTDDPLPTPVTNDVLNSYYRLTTNADRNELGHNFGDWRNTLVHEFGGHCFGRLSDEYWPDDYLEYNPNPVSGQSWSPVSFGWNVAASPSSVPWQTALMDRREELVARNPNYGRIGVFQGGDTYLYGRWRSEKISCMIDNRYYFSTWQRMLIVQRIMTLSGSTFDEAAFWAKDKTLDPVRDVISSQTAGSHPLPVKEVPLLPPPVLHEVD